MTPTEFQTWLNAHGATLVVDGQCGPATRAAIDVVFTNHCAAPVTAGDLTVLASRLGCTTKQLRAVAEVESGGGAFDPQGRPKILFERHLFDRFTAGKHSVCGWSNPKGGGYGDSSWEKLRQAACQDPVAAFAAVSWGKFQVLGAQAGTPHYPGFLDLGHSSPLELAYSTVTSEAAHYELLARYVEKAGLHTALASLSANEADNRAFAKGYNGGNYENFRYHTKLAREMA